MFIIVGLGNPGKEYMGTRHNVGFQMLDALAETYGISVTEKKHKALIGKGVIEGNKVVLVKPQTYMNLSGESLREVCDYYKVDPEEDCIVIYDDISLDVGKLRIRGKGRAGGHNGIKSLIQHLGTETFLRIRVGVGDKPKGYDLADYVLGHFGAEDQQLLVDAKTKVKGAVVTLMQDGLDRAMNAYNG